MVNLFLNLQVASFKSLELVYIMTQLFQLKNCLLYTSRSSTPEFGFKNISDAQIHGSVNLPDDVTRNADGSSSVSYTHLDVYKRQR